MDVKQKSSGEVPTELGRIKSRDLMTDPYGTLAKVRESSPAYPIENNGYRMWAITRYEDVRKVLADPTVLRDLVAHRHAINSHCLIKEQQRAHLPHGSRRSFFDRDGEHHHRLRALVGNVFTPAKLAELRPRSQRLADELTNALPVGEPVDIAADLARPMAGTIICELLGIPTTEVNLLATQVTEMITSPIISEIEKAAEELHTFSKDLLALKRREPADDLCTTLMHLHDQGQLTEDELTSTYVLVLVGGMGPSIAIGNGAFTLLNNPEELAKLLADPTLFEKAVDELVRYESNFRFVPPRYTSAPIEVGGVTIPAGELLLISPAAANRDPDFFDDPDVFDVDRSTKGHLGFGHGAHRCLGAQLGKIETATALRTLFQRYPRTELLLPPEEIQWRPGKFVRRLQALPVILKG
ncbi:hypothetical protein SD37_09280 [Amycolatopsis orientalis]|uniref:Cytochrome n=1 Tax=Amycolatopsis orientalis TaxID=31958 RepID=A0A193BUB9_AMYOR|nr:cytochrome P450 [Amycolatopsis orientalis]ANN15821.1 hypothetical protein SD37_09280 [Amycolatopsis orientalis]